MPKAEMSRLLYGYMGREERGSIPMNATRNAENRTMIAFSAIGIISHRRLARLAVILLAMVLGLAVSSVKAQAQAQTLQFSKTSVTVPEDESRNESYGVRLGEQPSGTVTVTVTVVEALTNTVVSHAKVDTPSLNFTTTNWDEFQTVTVTGSNDDVDNSNDTRDARTRHEASSDYGDGYVAVSVVDDDTVGLSITPETRLTVPEDGSDFRSFRVSLKSEPIASVTLTITAAPTEVVTFNGSTNTSVEMTFTTADWKIPQSVRVYGKDDEVDNTGDSRSATIKVDPGQTADEDEYSYDNVTELSIQVTVTDNDTAKLTLSKEKVPLDEGSILDITSRTIDDTAKMATYNVKLATEPSGNVRVDVTSADPKIATVSDESSSLTFTTDNWNMDQVVTINSVRDLVDNDGRSVRIKHVAYGGGYNGITAENEITITDDDVAGLDLGDAPTVIEGSETRGLITVALNSQPTSTVTVIARSADTKGVKVSKTQIGTAGPSISLSFTKTTWNTAQTVYVSGVDNDIEETGNRSVGMSFTPSGGGYNSSNKETVSVPVTADGTDESGMTITAPQGSITEGGPSVPYTVTLERQPARTATVTVSSTDTKGAKVSKTATGPPTQSISLSFTSTTPQTVYVFGEDNDIARDRTVIITHSASGIKKLDGNDANPHTGKENIQVTVSNQVDASGVTIDISDLGHIKENGGSDTYKVKLNSEPTSDVIVRVVNKSPEVVKVSPKLLTFTPGNWKSPKTVSVTGINDDVDNGRDRTATISHDVSGVNEYADSSAIDATVTVIDDDAAGFMVSPTSLLISQGEEDTFEVNLNTDPDGSVSVTVSSNDSNIATVSPVTLVFTSENWREPQEVTVTGRVGDASHIGGERDTEITITSTSTNGNYSTASRVEVDVTVTDEDVVVAPPGLAVTPTSLTIDQGRTGTYTVKLKTRPRGSVTVSAVSSDTAAATVSPGSRTFTSGNWETAQEFTVTGVASSDSTTTITNTASGRGYDNVSASVSVTVRAAGLILSKDAVTVTEASGADHTDTYTVRLKTQPTGTVTVAVASSNRAAATVSPAVLTFTTGNWSTGQTVTVTGINDSKTNDGGERSTTITHDPAGGGYDTVATVSVPVTVTDIPAGLVLSKDAVTVTEASGADHTDTYTVRLKTQPTGTVTVAVASSNRAAATVSPAVLTFTTGNWSTAQTVIVTGVDDSADNAADKRTVTISNRSSSAGYNAEATVTVTVTDDDAAPELSIEGASVPEGNTGATPLAFTVTKYGDTERVVTVPYADAGTGTARVDTDYTAVADGTLTFLPADTSKTITVMVRGDAVPEPDETVVIKLGSPSNARIAEGKGTATGTIDDDDASRLSIAAAAATVEEEGTVIFTVTLDPPIDDQPVMVDLAPGGTARPIHDYTFTGVPETGTLTFAAGEAAKTITVTVVDDADYELDETIVAELRNPRPTGDVVIETGTAMVTIKDNDDPPALSISGSSVAEGNDGTTSKLTFRVTKSGGTSMEVTVAYADAGTGTATAGTDYTPLEPGTLTFAPDEATKTVTVTVKGDDEAESNETVVIRLRTSPQSNATIAEGKGTATGTILDDDTFLRVASDWLARFGRTAAGATLDAIARRMNDGPATAEPSITVAGHRAALASAPVARVAAGIAEPWEEGRFRALTIEDLANGSSFDAEDSFVEGLNVWGASSYNQFEMTPQGAYTMDGSLVSAILGVDHQGDTHVAGLALAYHGGAGAFDGIGGTAGNLGTNLYSIHPYARLTFGEVIHVGGSFGIGTGDLRITDKDDTALVETGVGMPVLVALDARMELVPIQNWVVAVQTDGHIVQMVADERLPRFTRVETNTHRLRLGLENSFAFLVADGVSLAPVLETGLRYDGGDATDETGFGFDVGGGLRLDATVAAGLMVEARGHASLSNWGEDREQAPALRDWGVGGVIRWRPAGDGMGPDMSLAPAYGAALAGAAAPSLDAEIGYRMAAFGGVLTPYSAVEFSVTGQQSYRAGAHFELGQRIALSAEGTHRQSASGVVDQFLTLEVRLRQK